MTIIRQSWKNWLIIVAVLVIPLIPFYLVDQQWNPMEHAYQSQGADFLFYRGDITLQEAELTLDEWQPFDSKTDGNIQVVTVKYF